MNRPLALLLVTLALATGCTRAVRVDVEGAPVADAAPASPAKKFAIKADRIDPANLTELKTKLDQNIEQYLIAQGDKSLKPPYPLASATKQPEAIEATVAAVRHELESRGYVYDEQQPDVVVGVGVLFGHLDYEVAPTVHRSENFGAGRPVRPGASGSFAWPTETHAPYQGGYTAQGGHGAATEVTAIALQFSAPAGPQLWHGTAIAVGAYAKLDAMRPVLVSELVAEYPQPTGKPAQRLAPLPN
jgi:hypothetical protein